MHIKRLINKNFCNRIKLMGTNIFFSTSIPDMVHSYSIPPCDMHHQLPRLRGMIQQGQHLIQGLHHTTTFLMKGIIQTDGSQDINFGIVECMACHGTVR